MSKRKAADKLAWSDVKLKDLNLNQLKQLLWTRSVPKIPAKRAEMEELLKTKAVEVEYKDTMTAKQMQSELKLLGLDDSTAKKDVLLQRLKGEIAAPPKKGKKSGRGKKHKAAGAKVFVTTFDDPTAEEVKVVGVFTSEHDAYDAAINKLFEELKKKDEKRYQDLNKELGDETRNQALLKKVMDKSASTYGSDEEPKAVVYENKVK